MSVSVHFVKMLAMVEGNGKAKFESFNDNLQAQINYVNAVISEDDDYVDMAKFVDKFMKSNSLNSPASEVKNSSNSEMAERSRKNRDRGNQAYAKKDFDAALKHFSLAVLTGPISW